MQLAYRQVLRPALESWARFEYGPSGRLSAAPQTRGQFAYCPWYRKHNPCRQRWLAAVLERRLRSSRQWAGVAALSFDHAGPWALTLYNDRPRLRDQLICARRLNEMGKAGYVQMTPRNQQPLRRHVIEDATAAFRRHWLVDIELVRHSGTRHLDFGNMNGVSPDYQRFPRGFEAIAAVSWCVTGQRQKRHARRHRPPPGWGEAGRDRRRAWRRPSPDRALPPGRGRPAN